MGPLKGWERNTLAVVAWLFGSWCWWLCSLLPVCNWDRSVLLRQEANCSSPTVSYGPLWLLLTFSLTVHLCFASSQRLTSVINVQEHCISNARTHWAAQLHQPAFFATLFIHQPVKTYVLSQRNMRFARRWDNARVQCHASSGLAVPWLMCSVVAPSGC